MRLKIPWSRKVDIKFTSKELELFIKELLSGGSTWEYQTMFQQLRMRLVVESPSKLRRKIYEG